MCLELDLDDVKLRWIYAIAIPNEQYPQSIISSSVTFAIESERSAPADDVGSDVSADMAFSGVVWIRQRSKIVASAKILVMYGEDHKKLPSNHSPVLLLPKITRKYRSVNTPDPHSELTSNNYSNSVISKNRGVQITAI